MSVFDEDLILPGSITEVVSDYSYDYDSSNFGTTDSVTIIGTAFNGPVGKPIEIYSPEHAKYIFGEAYDYASKKSATLVASIQDAWDRGARTIYGVRVSGKEIFKDFQLAVETQFKLRVSGLFPSNKNKDLYFVFDNTTDDALTLKFYKPADRATIREKMQGVVESDGSIIETTLNLSTSYGLTKDSKLSDLISIFNNHAANNVLTLSIVDADGNDVLGSSKDAQSLPLGALFGGAYFIGRDKSECVAITNLTYAVINGENKPFEGFEGSVFKRLVINTDVSEDLPIFAESLDDINTKFAAAGVTMGSMFDILSIPGKVDQLFKKDTIDYEETELSSFDLYKKLGSGFAITAMAEPINNGTDIRIKETPANNDNRITAIVDGIYSTLENLSSDYRVLVSGCADEVIANKIPKKADFKQAFANSIEIGTKQVNGLTTPIVVAKAKIAEKDFTNPKLFKVAVGTIGENLDTADFFKDKIFEDAVIKKVATAENVSELTGKQFTTGTLFAVGTDQLTLYRYDGSTFVALNDHIINSDLEDKLIAVGNKIYKGAIDNAGTAIVFSAATPGDIDEKDFVFIESGDVVYVYKIKYTTDTVEGAEVKTAIDSIAGIGSVSDIFEDGQEKTYVVIENEATLPGQFNNIVIASNAFQYTTLSEFVDILNEHPVASQFFGFSIGSGASSLKDYYISELFTSLYAESDPGPFVSDTVAADKTIGYNTNLYIPYKTTDNFARHLAQHCTYTSLKTAPTHGIIGCTTTMNVGLNGVAAKFNQLLDLDTQFYAKKSNGKDMLDRNNLPYSIGKNVSIIACQYVVTDNSGYSFVSNGAAGYAGMLSILPLSQSSTNQPISIPTPMYIFTNYQLGKLTQKGFVTIKQSYSKGFVVTDGVTMALAESPFRRLASTRITNAVEHLIRAATEPFIGQQNNLSNRNSIQTAIKSELDKIKGKLVEAYDFRLIIDNTSFNLGVIDIDYDIVPINEIRQVRNRITIKDRLS